MGGIGLYIIIAIVGLSIIFLMLTSDSGDE